MCSIALFTIFFVQYAVAQSVTSLFIPGIVSQALVGSIVDINGLSTTYSIACPHEGDVEECGVNGVITAIEGPETAIINIVDTQDSISARIACNLNNSATASCTTTIDGSGAGSNTGVETMILTDISTMFLPVTITAGGSASQPTVSATTATGSATASGASATQTSKASNVDIPWTEGNLLSVACCLVVAVISITSGI